MAANSKIEWTHATWNPIEGCSMAKGSEAGGCLNCYAARTALRRPAAGLAVIRESGPRWTGKVGLVETRLDAPLHWKRPRRIFVNSMSDLFHEKLPVRDIDKVFAVMAQSPQHTFQILTKRPEAMLEYVISPRTEDGIDEAASAFGWCHANLHNRWPIPNVWLGVSVENQATADARIPLLLRTPSAVRFVSYEPALGPINFTAVTHRLGISSFETVSVLEGNDGFGQSAFRSSLDWVIAGGESGPGARPAHPDWFRSTRDQCVAAGVPFFFKQWGEWIPRSVLTVEEDWPVNEATVDHPNGRAVMSRIGKKKAGALLDGCEWKQFPEARQVAVR